MFVIGTAGHVDHGKSSLVRAMSGINPDRLREEQAREMTIDLGFAWTTLPSGREVSIVDVPGHEDFIRNMLAGVGSIDLALLVVAADEAVMPQTREHLAILDLLAVHRGVVALTKSDLIEDPEWLDLVVEEVRDALSGSSLAQAPIIPVSSVTGNGLPQLLATIDAQLDLVEPRPDLGRPRLPIDRVFSIAGFGTVVTGTLTDGHLEVGQNVEMVPGGRTARIRGLQSHKERVERALPGTRTAVNLVGVAVEDLHRGQVLCLPGSMQASSLVDVYLQVIADAPWPVKHGMEVEFFTGAAQGLGRMRLLAEDELPAGSAGWAQIRLTEPIALSRGDHFVIRMPSPSATLGGGVVVDGQPVRRHRRNDPAVLERLEALRGGGARVLLALLGRGKPLPCADLIRESQLAPAEAEDALRAFVVTGEIIPLVPPPAQQPLATWRGLVVTAEALQEAFARSEALLRSYHAEHPMRDGMPREEFRSRLALAGDWTAALIDYAVDRGDLLLVGEALALPEHGVTLSQEEQARVDVLMDQMCSAGYTGPAWSQVEAAVGSALAQFLLDRGTLVRLSDSVVYTNDTLQEMMERLREAIGPGTPFTVAQARDLLGASRKYVVALLEELDRRRVTRRIGDERVLR
ncbi:MAG: selenocysteine-specific translation elongation factor [Anaerolineae bacterium]